jgi:hypothetical protein
LEGLVAKAVDVFARIVELLRSRKMDDAEAHRILNGALVNGKYEYANGMMRGPKGVVDLSPAQIVSFAWPAKGGKVKAAPKPLKKDAKLPEKKTIFD